MWLKKLFTRNGKRAVKPANETYIPTPVPSAEEMDKFRADCAEGRNDGVREFLGKYSADYADCRGKAGWSPLMLAVWRGQAETVALLHKARQRAQHPAHHPAPKR